MSNKESSIFSPSKQLMADKLVSGQTEADPPVTNAIKTIDGTVVELTPFQRFTCYKTSHRFYLKSVESGEDVYHVFIRVNNDSPIIEHFKSTNKNFTDFLLDPITIETPSPLTVDGHMIKIGDRLGYDYPNRHRGTTKIYGEVKGYYHGCMVLFETIIGHEIGYTIVHSKYLFKY